MRCPHCGKNGVLQPRTYEGVEIDVCNRCHGCWLDEGELIRILDTREEKIPAKIAHQALNEAFQGVPRHELDSEELCPKCSKPMQAINYAYSSGVIVDRCSEHGVWLNHQELEKVQAHHEHWEKQSKQNASSWFLLVDDERDAYIQADMESNQKIRSNLGPISYVLAGLFMRLPKR